ncbi:hypothetical protein SLS60_002233 [Paraconiothyrium brasiliense]|uniref:Uncharacterized protein n=1 Tax=Paraconiothyrium brasiliense TaxID=300254 RepID=A0ABR3S1K6_9PLEO
MRLGGCSETRIHQTQARLVGPERPRRETQEELRKIARDKAKRKMEEEGDKKRERNPEAFGNGNKKLQTASKRGARAGREYMT